MLEIITSLLSTVIGIVTLAGMIATAFYAIKLLRTMRRGLLEKGWRLTVFAAFCLICGIFGLDVSLAGSNLHNIVLEIIGYSGAVLQAIGAITIAYGFKSQYDVWNPNEMKTAQKTNAPSQLQN
jgi:hypothetical protein